MKATFISIVLAAAALTGCALPGKTPQEFLEIPAEKLYITETTVAVPVSTAYRNILARARACWSQPAFGVDGDPFDTELGYALVSQRAHGDLLVSPYIIKMVEIYPDKAQGSKIVVKKRRGGIIPLLGDSDIPNVPQWAEGKNLPCA